MIKDKWPYLLIVLLLFGIGFLYVQCQTPKTGISLEESAAPKEKIPSPKTEKPEGEAPKNQIIVVDVKGAVKNPGVYRMNIGERVVDVLEKAGGLTAQADKKQVNLAKKLADEMVIYIPKVGETLPENMNPVTANGDAGGGKININTATEQELQQISGIGPSKAKAIIEYREKNGSFQTIEDLDKVSGIGEKTLEHMKDQITVQ